MTSFLSGLSLPIRKPEVRILMKIRMEKSKRKKVQKNTLKVVVRKPPSRAAKVKNEPKKEAKSSNKIKTEELGKTIWLLL